MVTHTHTQITHSFLGFLFAHNYYENEYESESGAINFINVNNLHKDKENENNLNSNLSSPVPTTGFVFIFNLFLCVVFHMYAAVVCWYYHFTGQINFVSFFFCVCVFFLYHIFSKQI